MKVFLTGGTGYLGGAVARALRDADHEVLALVRDRERAASLVGCGIDLVVGSLTDPGRWRESLAGCEGLVHVAGLVESWRPDPLDFDRVNIAGALDLVEAAAGAGVRRTVITSSIFALGPSPDGTPLDEATALDRPLDPVCEANDYVRTKSVMTRRMVERQAAGDPAILVYPTVLLGPGPLTAGNHTAKVIADIDRGRFPGLVGSGKQIWNLVGVDDAARGHVQALESGTPGGNYALGGEDWTQRELVERASELLGRKPVLRSLGTRLPRTLGALAEAWARWTGRAPLLTRGEVDLYDRHWSVSIERARAEIGYAPRPVQEVLEETVTWIRKRT